MRLRFIETGSLFTFTNSKTIKHGCILKSATTLFYILLILWYHFIGIFDDGGWIVYL